ncbi:MAG TPA: RNA polymerase sigma factor [Candidatus Bathyarchaeia archaeon]|nr:RNA polymerase sigma factor [Candidatus Bathyarchaeia archaeon]
MPHGRLNAQLAEFYTAHRQELFSYALLLAGSPVPAEDAVAEAFANVLQTGRTPSDLRPYLFRCVRNAAFEALRREGRERKALASYAVLYSETCEPGARDTAAEWLACLADHEREWVVLKVYGDLTFREIGEVCGVPQGTVASSYWRCLQKLRALLNPPIQQENQL